MVRKGTFARIALTISRKLNLEKSNASSTHTKVSCAQPIVLFPKPTTRTLQTTKMKAFLTAFNALFEGSVKTDSTEGDDDASQSDGDEHAEEELDNDVYNFLAKVGSLKE